MSDVNQTPETKSQNENIPNVPDEKSKADLSVQSGAEKNPDDGLPEGVKKRIGKLTREKYELKSQFESLKGEFDSLRTQIEAGKPAKVYESKSEEIADLVEKEISKRDKATEENKKHQEKVSKYVEKYNKTDDFVSDIEDFEDVVNSTSIDLSDPVDKDIADFCINSDSGKRLTYEIANSPELLETLRNMSYSVRAKTLIKLDEQLYSGISAKKAEAIVEKTIDEAPESENKTQKKIPKMIKPVTGKSTPKGNGPVSMEEYIANRNQRLAKK